MRSCKKLVGNMSIIGQDIVFDKSCMTFKDCLAFCGKYFSFIIIRV